MAARVLSGDAVDATRAATAEDDKVLPTPEDDAGGGVASRSNWSVKARSCIASVALVLRRPVTLRANEVVVGLRNRPTGSMVKGTGWRAGDG